jgi:RNA recognition motif-containing protein
VENILPDCHEGELFDSFYNFGIIESVKVIRDPETKDAQRAYVTYLDAKDTEAVLNATNPDKVEGGCRVSRLM